MGRGFRLHFCLPIIFSSQGNQGIQEYLFQDLIKQMEESDMSYRAAMATFVSVDSLIAIICYAVRGTTISPAKFTVTTFVNLVSDIVVITVSPPHIPNNRHDHQVSRTQSVPVVVCSIQESV